MAEDAPSPPPPRPRRLRGWMAVPVALLLAVAVVVASHAVHSWSHRPAALVPITPAQQDSALASARSDLGSRLAALGNASGRADEHGIVVNTSAGPKTVIPVFFTGNNSSLMVLVDSATGQVVQTVEIHSLGYMADSRGPWFRGLDKGFPRGEGHEREFPPGSPFP